MVSFRVNLPNPDVLIRETVCNALSRSPIRAWALTMVCKTGAIGSNDWLNPRDSVEERQSTSVGARLASSKKVPVGKRTQRTASALIIA
jgi:hypothetical protein